MELIIDTIDLEEVKELIDYLPIVGVTSNPSIVKRTHPERFFEHMVKLKKLIDGRQLHVQVISKNAEGMVEEAKKILDVLGSDTYIKIPASYEGIKAMGILNKKGVNITATAIYDLMQSYISLQAGAKYIAPYVNRISNLDGDPFELIASLSAKIKEDHYDCKIVAASFKNARQVKEAYRYGAQAATVTYDVIKTIFKNPNIEKAVDDFDADWYSMYGENVGILDIKD